MQRKYPSFFKETSGWCKILRCLDVIKGCSKALLLPAFFAAGLRSARNTQPFFSLRREKFPLPILFLFFPRTTCSELSRGPPSSVPSRLHRLDARRPSFRAAGRIPPRPDFLCARMSEMLLTKLSVRLTERGGRIPLTCHPFRCDLLSRRYSRRRYLEEASPLLSRY